MSAQDALTIGCFLFEVLHEAVLKELLRLRWRQELADRDERVICFRRQSFDLVDQDGAKSAALDATLPR